MNDDAAGAALDRARGWLEDLIRAAAKGPHAVQSMLALQMAAAGAAIDILDYRPDAVPMTAEFARASVASAEQEAVTIGRIEGTGGGRSLLLFAHPDTEPYRPEPQWASRPFEPSTRDDRLHGWGVADDLAGIAMLAASVALLQARGQVLAGDVILVAAPSKRHRRGISAALHAGIRADAALYLHPAESGRGLGEIKAFAPGQLEFTVTIEGQVPDTLEPAHTAFAHRGQNPITKAMTILEALRSLDECRAAAIRHPRLEAAIGRSTNLMVTHIEAGRPDVTTRLPEACRLRAALSLVPGEELDAVMRSVEAAIDDAVAGDPWLASHPPVIDWLAGVSAAETPDEAPFFQLVERAIRAFGTTPVVNPLHTSSDIRNPIVQAGIPTLGLGPLCGGLTMAGFADEWVDLADFRRSIEVTARIVADWCGTG